MGEFALSKIWWYLSIILAGSLFCLNFYPIYTYTYDQIGWIFVGIFSLLYFSFILIVITAPVV